MTDAPSKRQEINDIDVRALPPAERHPCILATLHTPPPNGVLRITSDHEPRPLQYQLATALPGRSSASMRLRLLLRQPLGRERPDEGTISRHGSPLARSSWCIRSRSVGCPADDRDTSLVRTSSDRDRPLPRILTAACAGGNRDRVAATRFPHARRGVGCDRLGDDPSNDNAWPCVLTGRHQLAPNLMANG
ncbi:DUF2249 domain-containing protein [Rhizobium sp. P40RR-XXII]|uniref:DUF2249 domain-containing protein n=1 Tax=Rhizobium sp. P40RR-XXII TaxID=2726739 RepID=UPI001456C630|nr:DUF2249 domain-containing protein [Rhizobium sp. P40RR-XXII]NLS20443.1 DUF2249 domain-containing protein [Rhizobium sp. P40RR-XXII]